MKRLKTLLAMLLAVCALLTGCKTRQSEQTQALPTDSAESTVSPEGELVVLYTNDVQNVFAADSREGNLGYAAVAAYRSACAQNGQTVVLIDGGNALFGGELGTRSRGSDAVSLMNETGYDFAVPGALDLTLGAARLCQLAEEAEYAYLACNFTAADSGEPVFAPYRLVDCGGTQVAFVGVCAPKAQESRTDGYDFSCGGDKAALYACVQQAIDNARADGAQYVICVGNTGSDPNDSPYTTPEIIANITGLCAYLDGGSASRLEGETVTDKDGNKIPLCSTPGALTALGEVRLSLADGSVQVRLISELTETDAAVQKRIDALTETLKDGKDAA